MVRFGRRKGTSGGPRPTQPAAESGEPAGAPATGEQPATEARSATGEQPPAAGPEPTIHERLEGQRAWLAQLDRRVGVRTYAGAAAIVLALAAAAVAVVLVLQLDDEAAKTSDIDRLRDQIAGVEDTATQAAQEDVQTVTERLSELEGELSEITSDQDTTDRQLSVIEDDIADLRDEIANIDRGGGGGNNP